MLSATALLLLFSAAGGFLFATRYFRLKYRIARESGYKLYLTSLTLGLALLLLSYITIEIFFYIPEKTSISPIVSLNETQKTLGIGLGIYVWALLLARIANCFDSKEKAIEKVWRENDFDCICARACKSSKPIALSLESRKAYVGYLIDTMSPDSENSHLTILPVLSGCRNKEDLKFRLDTSYGPIIKKIEELMEIEDPKDGDLIESELEDYYMAVPRDKIMAINIFNEQLYAEVVEGQSA